MKIVWTSEVTAEMVKDDQAEFVFFQKPVEVCED